MLTSITPKSIEALKNFLRTGNVAEIKDASHIRVRFQHDMRFIEIWASFAMGNQPLPEVGDDVLVAGENFENSFIIGLFPRKDAPSQVYSLEHDAKQGKTTITIPEGDLELCAAKGNINFTAAKSIQMSSPAFSLDATKGNINIAETQFKGLRFTAALEQSKLMLNRLNSTIGQLVEKTKNAYRHVEKLNQLKAGRMRTLVLGSYHLKGESITERADKDVRIDGNKINLG